MRIVVDGNNLMHALAELAVDADRDGLSRLLSDFSARTGSEVTVVFDGQPGDGNPARRASELGIAVHFSGWQTADEIVAELTAADSATRHLLVVSGDRQVQRQAKRQGCRVMESRTFGERLVAPPPRRAPAEPIGKFDGLSDGELEHWLEEFGLSDPAEQPERGER